MDLTGQALLLGDTSKAGPWEELVLNNLNKIGNYSLVSFYFVFIFTNNSNFLLLFRFFLDN